jgi:hypothetical protein
VALGAGDDLWITLGGVDGVAVLDVAGGKLTTYQLPDLGQGAREPGEIVLGPDGVMWFTERKGGRIGRVGEKGFIEPFFQLPNGCLPEELIAAADGRIYFTVQGRHLLGSMRAVAPSGTGRAGTGEASWQVPVNSPRPVRKLKLSAEARRVLVSKRIARAEARIAAAPEEPPPPPEWYRSEPAAEPLSEGKSEASPSPCVSSAERLESLAVNLAPRVERHILSRHGTGRRKDKSQFAPRYSSPEALQALLAECLGETEIGRIRSTGSTFDRHGCCLTYCSRDNVGWFNNYGRLVATSRFKVVTQWVQDEGGAVQDVVTAYPVSMNE